MGNSVSQRKDKRVAVMSSLLNFSGRTHGSTAPRWGERSSTVIHGCLGSSTASVLLTSKVLHFGIPWDISLDLTSLFPKVKLGEGDKCFLSCLLIRFRQLWFILITFGRHCRGRKSVILRLLYGIPLLSSLSLKKKKSKRSGKASWGHLIHI